MKIDYNIKKSPQFFQQYGILTLGTEKANPGKLGGAKLWALKGRQAAEVKQSCFIREVVW